MNTPAVTIVAAWISAETGVGPAMASGSQVCSGNWPLLPMMPMNKQIAPASKRLVIVIVAEMFIGSESGLGHRIIDAQQVFNVKEMYCSILVTGALGYLLNLLFLLGEKKLIHWSGKA